MVCTSEMVRSHFYVNHLHKVITILFFFRFDWRLIFVNLKKDERRKNIIGPEEQEKIWVPNLVFDNSVEDVQISNDPFSSLIVNDTGNSTITFNGNLQEDKQYDGSDNGITYSRVYKMKLLCIFEQHKYPFDSQTCFIKVNDHKLTY
jgi:hypothetical protein